MKIQVPYPDSNTDRSRTSNKGFTLTEILIAMAIFLIVVAGILSAHLFGLRMFQVNATKLNVTEWSRKTFGKITDEIHAANSITILTVDTNSVFTGLLDGEMQQGQGLQIFPTTNTANYSIYFVNPSDQTFRQTVGIRGVSTNTITLADSVTNTMAFSAQDLSGNILTNNLNSRVIHLKLEFYQPERYQQGSYYYQLETSVKQRITQ